MKIYIDESVSPAIYRGLRRRGWKARDAREENNVGLTDIEQMEFVKENNLLLFSYDDDFIRIVKKKGLKHPGIIYCDQRKYSIGETIRKLSTLLNYTSEKELKNQIEYL